MSRFAVFISAALLVFGSFFLNGCESTQDNNIAKAQKCLDGLGSNPSSSQAQSCLQSISGDYSADAEVIRCSADFIIGGINDTTLINAYNGVNGLSGNAVATHLMSALAQTNSGVVSTSTALTTYGDCQASGVSSLVYIAGLSYTGTLLASAAGSTSTSTIVNVCGPGGTNPSSCDPTTVGTVAQTVDSSYCTGSNSTSSVCVTLNNAIASGNGNPTTIGNNLLNLLQN